MAHRQSQFSSYHLPNVEDTGRVLGKGSSGVVVEMKLPNGTRVVGKKLHEIFFEPNNYSADVMMKISRFKQECLM